MDLKKKLLWQCRRGLWELDIILKPFVEKYFELMDSENQLLFADLLKLEDVELFDIFVNKLEPNDKRFNGLKDIIIKKHMDSQSVI
jgi:antitoxin CptB